MKYWGAFGALGGSTIPQYSGQVLLPARASEHFPRSCLQNTCLLQTCITVGPATLLFWVIDNGYVKEVRLDE